MSVMTRLARRFSKPHFLFRPQQILRRLAWVVRGPGESQYATLPLPWGVPIRCRLSDAIGGAIARIGVFELVVTEALWRLADPGELTVDAGANIGYMTSVLAARVGASGRVISFEPHPEVFAELRANTDAWSRISRLAPVDARQVALSDTSGELELVVGEDFADNHGVATLASSAPDGAPRGEQGRRWPVRVTTLDEVLGPDARVGVLKVDVEGHERKLFEGARRVLSGRHIRDIVFEAHGGYPSPVTDLLEGHGYRVFALVQSLLRPRALPPADATELRPPWEAANCLATLDPERAVARLRRFGWQTLLA